MSISNPVIENSRGPERSWRLGCLIGLAMLAAPIVWFAHGLIVFQLEHSDGGVRKIRRYVADLRAGKTKTLFLISIRNTDTLLEQVRGMPEIEDVYIEDTDITATGMRHLGALPNLKSIMAYDHVGGDDGMLELRGCTKLKHVSLYDRSITEDATVELQRQIPGVAVSTKHE